MGKDFLRDEHGRWAGSRAGAKPPAAAPPVPAAVDAAAKQAGERRNVAAAHRRYVTMSNPPFLAAAPFDLAGARITDDYAIVCDYTVERDDVGYGDRIRDGLVRQDRADMLFRSEVLSHEDVTVARSVTLYGFPGYRLDGQPSPAVKVRRDTFTSSSETGVVHPDGTFEASPSKFLDAIDDRLGEKGCPTDEEDFGSIDDRWYSVRQDRDGAPVLYLWAESERYETEVD